MITVEYLNDQPSSTYNPSTPYNTGNAWLWAIPSTYTGGWVAYHYIFDSNNPTIVTYQGYMYRLKQEVWPSTSNPAIESWAWECINCGESSATTCPPTYTTGYFPLNIAQQNNGNDNTSPVNNTGNGQIVGGMVRLSQERMCQTPLPLYNNDIYLRDACDPYAGLGYYGHADNRNVATPQKRFFADFDIDGPVLYGWNGGALGVRQRENWGTTTGVTTEKIALHWTPSRVYIGTSLIPMPLETYSTILCRNLTNNQTGYYVSGDSTARFFRAYNTETKKDVFNVSGIGNITAHGLFINSTSTTNYDYASKITVKHDLVKAFAIQDKDGNEVFKIWGNGIVNSQRIYAQSFHVRPDGNDISWYDYVFYEDYKLMPIEEVELFVSLNKHLPDIPSERDINESGFDLVEMNALLLKKIEELTLYLIEQNKRINELEQIVVNQ